MPRYETRNTFHRVRLDVDTGPANVILQKEKFYQNVQQKM